MKRRSVAATVIGEQPHFHPLSIPNFTIAWLVSNSRASSCLSDILVSLRWWTVDDLAILYDHSVSILLQLQRGLLRSLEAMEHTPRDRIDATIRWCHSPARTLEESKFDATMTVMPLSNEDLEGVNDIRNCKGVGMQRPPSEKLYFFLKNASRTCIELVI